MRFIRDIIAEKTQAPDPEGTGELRYPLRLREQDRADRTSEMSQPVNVEADFPASEPMDQKASPEPVVSLAAISEALAPQEKPQEEAVVDQHGWPEEATEQPTPIAEAPGEVARDPFANLFSQEDVPQAPMANPDFAIDAAPEPEPLLEQPEAPEPVQEQPTLQRVPAPEPVVAASPEPSVEPPQTDPEEVDLTALQLNVNAHKPASGRGSKGRVKTRLLGFSAPASPTHDPMSATAEAPQSQQAHFPVGWLVVVDGPGMGASFSLFDGLTQIGRGEGQTVCLDFGDSTISRENHAAIAFDGEQRRFFFGHGGKANLVRLNGRPVLSTEPLEPNSIIRIGETTLRFVALCGEDFTWGDASAGEVPRD